jgi:multiple sugar transport system permease protein
MAAPLCYTLILSFFKTDIFSSRNTFVAFRQFGKLLNDSVFLLSVKNTFFWTLSSVFSQFIIGFMLGYILYQWNIRHKTVVRILLMVPWVMPSIVSAMIWQWSYHPDFGIINEILKRAGLIANSVNWLSSRETALVSAVVVNVWKMVPFVVLYTEAALQGVPAELRDAALVDGATHIQVFWNVTVPYIRATMNTIILLLAVWTMNAFTFIFILTEGGPAHQSEILSLFVYRSAFKNYEFGLASAAATILFVLTAVIALFYNRYVIGREVE